jgi:large subunit ribosomal protein L10
LNRTEKEVFVGSLKEGVSGAKAFALMSFEKLDVERMTSFRLALRKKDVTVKVLKNTLARRVFDDGLYSELSQKLQGPILVAFSPGDPVETAKVIFEWAERAEKEGFGLRLQGGAALGKVISIDQLRTLSKLPGRNELLVGFLWALKSSPTNFLYALSDMPRRLGYALCALRDKREKES